jgi:hypothetical protein
VFLRTVVHRVFHIAQQPHTVLSIPPLSQFIAKAVEI